MTGLIFGLWGASGLSLWRDEAITAGVARRPATDILRYLSHIDAVHGAYYLLMHGVVRIFGASELALRLPSIAALAATAAGVAVLGRRLVSPLAGLLAGLLYAGAPFASRYAHEARPYAITTALAVLATLLLLRALERASKRRYAAYGASVALLGAFNIFALLLVPAHLITFMIWARGRGHGNGSVPRSWFRWLCAVTAAVASLSPLIAIATSQRGAVSWLRRPGLSDIAGLAHAFAGSKALTLPVALAVLGGIACSRRPREWIGGVGAVALPWLLLPAAILIAVSQFSPVFLSRYVLFSLPAAALLAGAGLARLPRASWVIPLVVIAVMSAQPHLSQRDPERRPDHLREAAAIIDRHARPGDAVVYLPANRRAVGEAYPGTFGRLRDITMTVSPAKAANFGGAEAGPDEMALALRDPSVTRAWFVEGEAIWRGPSLGLQNAAKIGTLERSFQRAGYWRVRGLRLTLYARPAR